MNDGLAILVGWVQWLALVALLLVVVLRDVAHHHDQRDVTYQRRDPDPDPPGPTSPT
ncbi:hypothetical protein [Aquihabitans sp. McL0605]|uniref:hypothetical protein n=1 Tax=Aquihabitans sp. McL0605 TaxID=3415671 RepID=UPI003CF70AF5